MDNSRNGAQESLPFKGRLEWKGEYLLSGSQCTIKHALLNDLKMHYQIWRLF